MRAADLIRMPRSRPGPRWETPDPPGVTGTYGDAAIAWAKRELRIVPGPWQAYVIRKALRHDKHGNLIHRTVLLSTARQNGKSVIVRIIFGWLLDEGRALPAFASWTTMLAAAHDAKQARIVYRNVFQDFGGNPRLKAQTRLTQYFGIEAGGLMLDTVTSQPGSARGLSAGLIAWDEMLTQEDWDMWEALSPTQSAQRNPLMILTSTAGHPRSVVLRAFYDRLVRQATGDEKPEASFYGAWWQSEDPDAGLDWAQLRLANPALGDGRLSKDFIRGTEWGNLPPDSWKRERLNHWVDVAIPGAFAPGAWARTKAQEPLKDVDPPFVLAVDIQPGWERATIVAAGVRADGRIGIEVFRDIRAADHGAITAESLIEAIEAFPDPVAAVVYDSVSGAAAEFDRHGLNAWGVDWVPLKPAQVVTASMDTTEMILSGRIAVDDPLLDAQLPTVARRDVGQEGAFRFTRRESGGPIDAFMALTFAAHYAASMAPPPKIL